MDNNNDRFARVDRATKTVRKRVTNLEKASKQAAVDRAAYLLEFGILTGKVDLLVEWLRPPDTPKNNGRRMLTPKVLGGGLAGALLAGLGYFLDRVL